MIPPFRNVLLLNPPSGLYRRDDRCQSRVEDQTVRIVFPPVDLALLAAVLRKEGAQVKIADYPARNLSWEQYHRDLLELKPDTVLFNVTTATIRDDLQAARLARRTIPGIRTIARGEYFEKEGETLFDQYPELDLALHGEVEENLARLARGESPSEMPAALYRNQAGVRRNTGTARIEDLDSLPFPARDLLDNTLYRSPETGNPLTVILANRGCPAKCVFCPAGEVSGFRLRLRSPESIVAELRECVQRFNIHEFLFNGDTFTMRKPWLLHLCAAISEAGLSIRWGCNSRVDTMDAERAQALKRAGCWVVAFGVESGDQEMLDRMKKGTRLEQSERAIAVSKEAGLATHTFFIIGLPWETRASLQRTYALARKLDPDFFDINIAYPLPGTELYQIAVAEGLLENPAGSYAQASMRTFSLSAAYLTRWRKRALLKLYLRPGYIVRTIVRARRAGVLPHYLLAAAQRLKGLIR